MKGNERRHLIVTLVDIRSAVISLFVDILGKIAMCLGRRSLHRRQLVTQHLRG